MGVARTTEVRATHLPPPEAWKEPDKWVYVSEIDDQVRAKPDIRKIAPPLDDRKFIKIDELMEEVLDLFWSDYDWRSGDQLRTDIHHFYWPYEKFIPLQNGYVTLPYRFRENFANKGRMPRLTHNVIHEFTNEVDVPNQVDLQEFLDRAAIAVELFAAAQQTVFGRSMFRSRRDDVRRNPHRLSHGRTEDYIGEDYMRSNFERQFTRYAAALDRYNEIREDEFGLPVAVEIPKKRARPDTVIAAFGKVVRQNCVNYTDLILNAA